MSAATLREISLTLPMLPDMEIAASKTVTALAEYMEMSPDRIDEVRMAVLEACINAFEHSRSEEGKVLLTFSVLGTAAEPEKLRIRIEDSGVGFDPSEVVEPNIQDKLKAKSKRGWGLKIIRSLMDEVDIHSNSSGTTVIMTKYRADRGE
ncbi:MAG: ATP-binding protein [Acidobacteriota bacterium]|nr:ATP-binding protein [Acidobacteriota bacterium]MDH3524110.1 ATP-binding protein [Acidobacteriota bacterium]